MAIHRFSLGSRPRPEPGHPPSEPVHAVRSGAAAKPFSAPESNRLKERILDAKLRIHGHIIDEVNLAMIEKLPVEELRPQVHELVVNHVNNERLVLNDAELELFVDDILHEMKGLGPIEMLLKDDSINDILINTHRQIYIERSGVLELSEARFKDEAHLLRIINKIVSTVGRRVDESQPFCDARLLDGSRVNVAIKPVAIDGPLVSIRKFSKRPYSMDKLVDGQSLSPAMAALLSAAVLGRITLLVSGGTGTGKTTMLNALSSFISPNERLITIEDAAELQLQQPHVCRMETRPPSIEGKGEIRQRELVRNALRMRPDRIIIGECRGEEAFDMLQAMNTGHDGSMTSVHANSARDALLRLEQMVGMASFPMTTQSIRTQIASAVRLVIQLARMSDGKRRIVSISEITGMEEDVIQMQEIFRFQRTAMLEDGTIQGEYLPTGLRPRFLADLAALGITLPASHFDPGRTH